MLKTVRRKETVTRSRTMAKSAPVETETKQNTHIPLIKSTRKYGEPPGQPYQPTERKRM